MLAFLARGGVGGDAAQEGVVFVQAECRLLDPHFETPARKILAQPQQFLGAHRIETDLVEEPQQPRLGEILRLPPAIPHLDGAPDELITARPFHPINAHVSAADADRVFGRPRPRGIVFRSHEPVPRIERHGDGRAEIHVAETEHEVAGVEDDLLHLLDGIEAVDAADELDVARAPRRVWAHAGRVFFDRELRGGIVPRERQMHDARGQFQGVERRQAGLAAREQIEQFAPRELPRVVVDLQRADAGREVDHAGHALLLQPCHQRVDAEAQFEVEHVWAELDEHVVIALRAEDHLGHAIARRIAAQRGIVGNSEGVRRAVRVRGELRDLGVLISPHRGRRVRAQRHEAHAVAGLELPDLPKLRLHDARRAHESAEARAVRPEDDRHVAGEIDGADGVGVVVDVRRMQARLAAVAPRPVRLRTDEPDAGAGGVEMHLPIGGEEHRNVLGREKIRRAVRPV